MSAQSEEGERAIQRKIYLDSKKSDDAIRIVIMLRAEQLTDKISLIWSREGNPNS